MSDSAFVSLSTRSVAVVVQAIIWPSAEREGSSAHASGYSPRDFADTNLVVSVDVSRIYI